MNEMDSFGLKEEKRTCSTGTQSASVHKYYESIMRDPQTCSNCTQPKVL